MIHPPDLLTSKWDTLCKDNLPVNFVCLRFFLHDSDARRTDTVTGLDYTWRSTGPDWPRHYLNRQQFRVQNQPFLVKWTSCNTASSTHGGLLLQCNDERLNPFAYHLLKRLNSDAAVRQHCRQTIFERLRLLFRRQHQSLLVDVGCSLQLLIFEFSTHCRPRALTWFHAVLQWIHFCFQFLLTSRRSVSLLSTNQPTNK